MYRLWNVLNILRKEDKSQFNKTVDPKMRILSLYLHVITNLYDYLFCGTPIKILGFSVVLVQYLKEKNC